MARGSANRVLVLGKYGGGKSTLLQKTELCCGQGVGAVQPTMGFHLERLEVPGSAISVEYTSWDFGHCRSLEAVMGDKMAWGFYRYYFAGGKTMDYADVSAEDVAKNPGTAAVVWVVDSMEECLRVFGPSEKGRLCLHRVMEDENLRGPNGEQPVLLVLANKQDRVREGDTKSTGMRPSEVAEMLGLTDESSEGWVTRVPWFVQGTSLGSNPEGLQEALRWLYDELDAREYEAVRGAPRHYHPVPHAWCTERHGTHFHLSFGGRWWRCY